MKRSLAALAVLLLCAAHTALGAGLDDPVVVPKATVQSELNRGHVAANYCLAFPGPIPGHDNDPYSECIDRILSDAAVDNTLTRPFETAVLFDAFATDAVSYDNAKREKALGQAGLEIYRVAGEFAFKRLSAALNDLGLSAAQVCTTTPHSYGNYTPGYCVVVLKYADATVWEKYSGL